MGTRVVDRPAIRAIPYHLRQQHAQLQHSRACDHFLLKLQVFHNSKRRSELEWCAMGIARIESLIGERTCWLGPAHHGAVTATLQRRWPRIRNLFFSSGKKLQVAFIKIFRTFVDT